MKNRTLFRIQNAAGRGPWKPGFSVKWVDPDRNSNGPDVITDFGIGVMFECQLRHAMGFHMGCACKDLDQLKRWFNRSERTKLKEFGYEIVKFTPDFLIAESDWQVIFANKRPLADLMKP